MNQLGTYFDPTGDIRKTRQRMSTVVPQKQKGGVLTKPPVTPDMNLGLQEINMPIEERYAMPTGRSHHHPGLQHSETYRRNIDDQILHHHIFYIDRDVVTISESTVPATGDQIRPQPTHATDH